jgi:hypothetical protein
MDIGSVYETHFRISGRAFLIMKKRPGKKILKKKNGG